ncbi:MAG: hypothetical protein LW695_07025 [Phenylobacterium sp.]|nr:hypothetical protein [Phenylobacterium sp.]
MSRTPRLAAPQDRYAENDGVKIHYVVEGEGPLVVMIHGFPDYWATWKPTGAQPSPGRWPFTALTWSTGWSS